MAGFFITGTDTGVGKTWASVALMQFLKSQGLTVIGMKPVASGCFRQEGELRNEDALLLMEQASFPVDYAKVNPYPFEPPVSPHIAARRSGQTIDVGMIVERLRELELLADYVLVEGIGGWEVPLNERERVSDLAKALGLPVILVVGMRLGCINHALLSHEAIVRSGVSCAGWIANRVNADFTDGEEENIDTLLTELATPCLADLPHGTLSAKTLRNIKEGSFPVAMPRRNLAQIAWIS
ncbi:MAG: dethiobiotin synthase [Methylococcaceae bacterium]|nr:dethiobiotin synthase [Methylococcaceae bacterium]